MLFGSRKLAKSRSFSSLESFDAEGPAGFDTSTIGVELQPIKNNDSNDARNSDFFIFQISS
jgi:hypothetical protein